MCGIAGISTRSSASQTLDLKAIVERMIGALKHRGPDDVGMAGIKTDPGAETSILLGNTRLAIQDLSAAGHQPMFDPVTGNWIVLNGEIYNHPELRRRLVTPVNGWQSGSDTETVLKAYAEWGPACVDHLRGMFALAVWDNAKQQLWCVRDRLGIKPFYYWQRDGLFLFASEVQALLKTEAIDRRVDQRGLAGYVRFGSVPEPHTLVENLYSLPAGQYMYVGEGKVTEQHTYWSPSPTPVIIPFCEAAKEVRGHLERAVHEHLLSDVSVGTFLSGGIDSSIITALAVQSSSSSIKTFTVGFGERNLDESTYAQVVATRYRTEHHRIHLSDDEVVDLISQAVDAMDLPSADGINTYVVSNAVANAGIKVVLSGLGGDELFGGYRSFRILPSTKTWAPLLGRIPSSLRRMAAGKGSAGGRVAEITTRGLSLRERYNTLRAQWSKIELEAFGLNPEVGYEIDNPKVELTPATQVSLLELQGYMRNTILRDSDLMSMAHSLELRVPFLDHELVDCCLRLGAADHGHKKLLLAAAGELLPPGIADRPKQGFVLPMDRWMRTALDGYVAGGLEKLERSGLLPGFRRDELTNDFETGRLQWSRLWSLVVLGYWVNRNINDEYISTGEPGVPAKFQGNNLESKPELTVAGTLHPNCTTADEKPIHIWTPDLYGGKGGIQVFSHYLIEAVRKLIPDSKLGVFVKNDRSGKGLVYSKPRLDTYASGRWPSFLRTLAFATQIFKHVIRERPKLIISTHLHFAPIAYLLLRITNTPYWVIAHGIEAWDIDKPLLRRSLRHAERTLAVSAYTRDQLISQDAIDPEKIFILPNTVDSQKFRVTTKPDYLLKRYHLERDQPVIFTLSRLSINETYKGYDKILQALPTIQETISDVKYILAGKGDDMPRIQALIKSLGLDRSVILTGFLHDSELSDHYSLCDVFAMPSKKEGFGIVYLEAMASGKPTLAGNKDGSVDALRNGELGVLLDPDDVELLGKALIEILNHEYPHPLMYKPEELREKVVSVYGIERFTETLRGHLSGFLNGRDSHRLTKDLSHRGIEYGTVVPASADPNNSVVNPVSKITTKPSLN